MGRIKTKLFQNPLIFGQANDNFSLLVTALDSYELVG